MPPAPRTGLVEPSDARSAVRRPAWRGITTTGGRALCFARPVPSSPLPPSLPSLFLLLPRSTSPGPSRVATPSGGCSAPQRRAPLPGAGGVAEWTPTETFERRDVPGAGPVAHWVEVIDVRLPFVTFRHSYEFASDGAVLTGRTRPCGPQPDEIERSLAQAVAVSPASNAEQRSPRQSTSVSPAARIHVSWSSTIVAVSAQAVAPRDRRAMASCFAIALHRQPGQARRDWLIGSAGGFSIAGRRSIDPILADCRPRRGALSRCAARGVCKRAKLEAACPGRSAAAQALACAGALQTRDRYENRLCNGPGSAVHRFARASRCTASGTRRHEFCPSYCRALAREPIALRSRA